MDRRSILMILGGMFHDFVGFREAMAPVLDGAGFDVEASYDLDRLLALEGSSFDVVLSYTSLSAHRPGRPNATPETLTPEQTNAMVKWVRGGRGLLGLHSATVSGQPNPEMRSLYGGVFDSHPPQFAFTVYPMRRKHPITDRIMALTVTDEFYIQDCDPSIDVHMIALDRGVAHPMVWTRREGIGRVAYVAMGHSELVWKQEPYKLLVVQALDWLTTEDRRGDTDA